jgi:hypothetical protein
LTKRRCNDSQAAPTGPTDDPLSPIQLPSTDPAVRGINKIQEVPEERFQNADQIFNPVVAHDVKSGGGIIRENLGNTLCLLKSGTWKFGKKGEIRRLLGHHHLSYTLGSRTF